jgi:hypothetical protein
VWREEVIEEWKGPKPLLSDAHHLLDLLCAKLYVAGSYHSYPPFRTFPDKRFRDKSVPELAELLWFVTARFSSFASPAVDILEGLQALVDKDSPMVDAEWHEHMHKLLEALAAEQAYTRDATDLRNRRRGGEKKAQQDRERLAPMLDVAKAVAQELWLKNGRKFKWDDNRLINTETHKQLPDDQKGLIVELTRAQLVRIREEIKAAFPPPKSG